MHQANNSDFMLALTCEVSNMLNIRVVFSVWDSMRFIDIFISRCVWLDEIF